MKSITGSFWVAGLLLVLLQSCAGSSEKKSKELELVYVNWSEGIAITHLAEVVLEQKLGYEVKLQVADVGPVYASLANGDKDAFLDAWLPVTHDDYMEKFSDKLLDLGVVFEKARLGLVVPAYSSLKSIPGLAAKKDRFNSEIIGIDSGAGIMRKTEKALEIYGLNAINLLSSSGPAMTTGLKEAVQKKEEIVVTGWYPHWMFARFDLRFLEDPEKVYGSKEQIHKITRQGFVEDHPKAAAFLKKFKLEEDHLLSMLNKMEQTDKGPAQIALDWYKAHPEVVEQWVSQ